MASEAGKNIWTSRITALALALSIGGVAAALVSALGSGRGAWDFRTGFTILRYAFFAAIAGGILALVALVLARRARAGLLRPLVALVVALGFVAYLGNLIMIARSVPAIHDATTNLDDPPQFSALDLRADNLENIPDNGDPALKALSPDRRWKALHRQAYGDLATVRLAATPSEAIARVQALAQERGWEIARADPARGELEATDTSLFFRFKDDVAVRARPAPGGGSAIDVRSVSRVGGSDLGVNAKRVRALLADLQRK